jgi:hypothetical protein
MKKNEKYVAVNNQEDEDGYILHPGYAIDGRNNKDDRTARNLHRLANVASDAIKPPPGKPTRSNSVKTSKANR